MSVAFDDQGEMVPRRGTTIRLRPDATVTLPPLVLGVGPYRKSSPRTRDSSADSEPSTSTKCR